MEVNCNIPDERRKQGYLCRGMYCKKCIEARLKNGEFERGRTQGRMEVEKEHAANQLLIDKKEFNLNERRSTLHKIMMELQIDINSRMRIMNIIYEDDDEFIERLKEERILICGNRDIEFGEHHPLCEKCMEDDEIINKLVGKKTKNGN